MRGKALPHYGKLNVKTLNPEVHRIWLTRNEEPNAPQIEPENILTSYEDAIEDIDFMRKIWDHSKLNTQQCYVLLTRVVYGATLEEVGSRLQVTRERIRQIEAKAIRKLQRAALAIHEGDKNASLNNILNRSLNELPRRNHPSPR